MNRLKTLMLPFDVLGPGNRYWLDAFRVDAAIHEFLPLVPLAGVPFPEARAALWRDARQTREKIREGITASKFPLSSPQKQALDEILLPDTLMVATGQQPGALGGPLYTFSKILTAVVLADRLREEWEIPVVPVLWDGGDDHDLPEIDQLIWNSLEKGNEAFHFGIAEKPGRPAWSVDLETEQLEALKGFLEGVQPQGDYGRNLIELVSSIWRESTTWCDFYDRFWLRVFENCPLLVIRPWERAFRELAVPILETEILLPDQSRLDIEASSEQLALAGYKPLIHKSPGTCPFFFIHEGQRLPVREVGGDLVVEGVLQKPPDRFLQDYQAQPESLSPNATLRPVVQDAILPTGATVLGPSEIAYHAQLDRLYRRHGIPRAPIVPRLSMTIASHAQIHRMEETGLAWGDLQRDDRELMKRAAAATDDLSLAQARLLESQVQEARSGMIEHLQNDRKHLVDPVDSQFGRIEKTIQQIQDLIARDIARRDSIRLARIQNLKNTLYPDGDLQERIFSLAYFMGKFGQSWVESLIAESRTWDGKNHIVYIPGEVND